MALKLDFFSHVLHDRILFSNTYTKMLHEDISLVCDIEITEKLQTILRRAVWPNWIRHQTSNLGIAGSSPVTVENFLFRLNQDFMQVLFQLVL